MLGVAFALLLLLGSLAGLWFLRARPARAEDILGELFAVGEMPFGLTVVHAAVLPAGERLVRWQDPGAEPEEEPATLLHPVGIPLGVEDGSLSEALLVRGEKMRVQFPARPFGERVVVPQVSVLEPTIRRDRDLDGNESLLAAERLKGDESRLRRALQPTQRIGLITALPIGLGGRERPGDVLVIGWSRLGNGGVGEGWHEDA